MSSRARCCAPRRGGICTCRSRSTRTTSTSPSRLVLPVRIRRPRCPRRAPACTCARSWRTSSGASSWRRSNVTTATGRPPRARSACTAAIFTSSRGASACSTSGARVSRADRPQAIAPRRRWNRICRLRGNARARHVRIHRLRRLHRSGGRCASTADRDAVPPATRVAHPFTRALRSRGFRERVRHPRRKPPPAAVEAHLQRLMRPSLGVSAVRNRCNPPALRIRYVAQPRRGLAVARNTRTGERRRVG